MLIYNGNLLIGLSSVCANNSILAWGKANGFIELGVNDLSRINKCVSVFIVRNPDIRMADQLYTYIEKYAELQHTTLQDQWNRRETLLVDMLSDHKEIKDWFSMEPVTFVKQSAILDKYKSIEWDILKLENFNTLADKYELPELSAGITRMSFIDKIKRFLDSYSQEKKMLYGEDYALYDSAG